MDLFSILKARIDVLPEGAHTAGLRSVLFHIETAFLHLSRGQTSNDDSAFTDAVYRTNQAFEGSVKEAYRVLAGKDPNKKNPFEIEKYLQDKKIFGSKVLLQFTRYRKEWRNPSTHDYTLSFDESEAFLAIVSVAAFACLVLGQIAQKFAYDDARRDAVPIGETIPELVLGSDNELLEKLEGALLLFLGYVTSGSPRPELNSEAQFVGALSGYLSQSLPGIELELDHRFVGARERADMLASVGKHRAVIEVKRLKFISSAAIYDGIGQIERYVELGSLGGGVLLMFSNDSYDYRATHMELPRSDKAVLVIHPIDALEL